MGLESLVKLAQQFSYMLYKDFCVYRPQKQSSICSEMNNDNDL